MTDKELGYVIEAIGLENLSECCGCSIIMGFCCECFEHAE
jgi:hypothetical protein